MKKLISVLMLMILMLSFASCEKDELNDFQSITYYVTYFNSVSNQPVIEIFTGEATTTVYETPNNIVQPFTISLTEHQLSLITEDNKMDCVFKSSVVSNEHNVYSFYVVIDGEKINIPY